MEALSRHMHHKFALVDGRLLLTGSYNWCSTQPMLSIHHLFAQHLHLHSTYFHHQDLFSGVRELRKRNSDERHVLCRAVRQRVRAPVAKL